MSLTVFSAGAQLSAVNLLQVGASGGALVVTTLLLNLHQVLFGLSLSRLPIFTRNQRWIAAYFLNDGAYGATITSPAPSFAFLIGAELSMFVVWNVATTCGVLVGQALPNLGHLGLDFVVPLLFLALLLPQLRSRANVLIALCAGLMALSITRIVPPSIALLVAVVAASILGGYAKRDA